MLYKRITKRTSTQSLAPETASPTKAGVYISFEIILQQKKIQVSDSSFSNTLPSGEKDTYHQSTGPDTNRAIDIKFGTLTKLSNILPLLPSSSLDKSRSTVTTFGSTTDCCNPNCLGNLALLLIRSNLRFKASTFLKTAPFPRQCKGVADWSSIHGGEDRKRGPLRGANHLESGDKRLEKCETNGGGIRETVPPEAAGVAVVKNGLVLR